ncbi:uncharacterized protein [Lolium perenne]|uniref:uncharacterized protein isoform X1 n=1 Tax=Lolium perenne TaxID=4522 RepID=UPI003A9A4DF6
MIMAFSAGSVGHPIAAILLLGLAVTASAQLSATFYDASCPSALATIKSAVTAAVNNEPRMGASLLRLHFHDCFVQLASMCRGARVTGMRRVGAPQRHRQLHRRADGVPQPQLHQGTQRHRQRQGAGGGRLRADRLLRRHPHRRRPRLHRRPRRTVVHGSAGEEGLHHREPLRGEQGPPAADLRPRRSRRQLLQERPQRHRHGCALRSPHDRAGGMLKLPEPDLRRLQHRPGVRGVAAGQLPAVRPQWRRHTGAARRVHPRLLRQRLLRQPSLAAGAPPLRPAALQRRLHRRPRQYLLLQRRAVQLRLRRGHGEHGQHRRAHGRAGGDPAQLWQGELSESSRSETTRESGWGVCNCKADGPVTLLEPNKVST